jgi:hypothetical protein
MYPLRTPLFGRKLVARSRRSYAAPRISRALRPFSIGPIDTLCAHKPRAERPTTSGMQTRMGGTRSISACNQCRPRARGYIEECLNRSADARKLALEGAINAEHAPRAAAGQPADVISRHDVRFTSNSRLRRCSRSCRLSADIVAKVFSG